MALGFPVGVYAYKSFKSRTGVSSEPVTPVIVAADDLQVGTRIEKRDIKIIRIPIADLPSGARAGARMCWDMA